MAKDATTESIPTDQQNVGLGQQIVITPIPQGTAEHAATAIDILAGVLSHVEAQQNALPALRNAERDAVWSVLDFIVSHGRHQLNLLRK